MQISNRVFWASVFLAGCAIVSGRAQSGQTAAPAPATDAIVPNLRARQLEIVDTSGHVRLTVGVDKTNAASVCFYRSSTPYDLTMDLSSFPTSLPGLTPGTTADCQSLVMMGLSKDHPGMVFLSDGNGSVPFLSISDARRGRSAVRLAPRD